MSAWFKTLFTLSVAHEYYGGQCTDFDYLLSADTRRLARNGRLLLKGNQGTLYCVYEADGSGSPLLPLAGETLRIGLRLTNPHFTNFTEWSLPEGAALYRNLATPGQFDSPLPVRLAGSVIAHQIGRRARPVTLSLVDAAGVTLQTDQIGSGAVDRHSYRAEMLAGGGAMASGYCAVRETYAAATGEAHYYVEPELLAAGVFGIAEIRLDSTFYAAAPAFEIAFSAKKQKIRYYVVASKYPDAEFAKLAVSDEGFGEDQRAEVKFTRVAAANFTADELDPGLVAATGDKVTLFRSDTAQARQASARSRIQLQSNSDVLIHHLPAPLQDQPLADLIIHVAKP
jgi:hypothetical protein